MKPLNFVALLLFIAGLVWVFTLSQSSVRQIQKTYYSVFSPMVAKSAQSQAFANDFVKEVEHSKDLERQLAQANSERDRFRLIAARSWALETENNELRNALAFKKETKFDIVPARVIRRQPQMWGKTIEINRGSETGLQKSMCVLASNGGLIGRVQLPGNEVSSVLLITDEVSQVSAKVEGTTEVGLIIGRRTTYGEAPRLRMRYLSKNAILRKGMKVYTDGRGDLFPAGIPIGTIEDFEVGPVYGEAEIIPSVDLTNIKTVFVIADSNGE